MKSKFCPVCGRETDLIIEKLCSRCFKEKNKLATIPEEIKITVCKNCGKIKETKVNKITERGLREIILKNIKINGKKEKIKIKKIKEMPKKIKFEIKVTGLLKGVIEKKETLETKIIIKDRLCDICGKVKGGYYEAVIQLRSENEEKNNDALFFLENEINKKGFLTKIEEKKKGFDVYFAPKKIANNIIKNIKDVKEIKKSYTLATKKDGRDLYRNTILVRL